MAIMEPYLIVEGAFLSRPLVFLKFSYWKDRMEMNVNSTQYQLRQIITSDDIEILSPEEDWKRKSSMRCSWTTKH